MNRGEQPVHPNEREMMRQAYRYLSRYSHPPVNRAPDAAAWWRCAAREMAALDAAWNGHPLMRGVLIALYEYIE